MKPWDCCRAYLQSAKAVAWFVGVAGSALLLGVLAWWILLRTQPPGVDTARAKLRYQYLAEIRAADHEALTTAGVVDKAKGIYRVPITNAMDMLLQLSKDPVAGRSNLLDRAAKAAAKPPEKPSEYE